MIQEKCNTSYWQNTMKNKIYGLTYAGGTADFYSTLKDILYDEGIDFVPLEYAGHGRRRKEASYKDFTQLSEDMTEHLIQNLQTDERYYLMGYSMGTIAVVEILKRLIAMKYRLPAAVILAAHEPKSKSELSGWNKDISDDVVKERIMRFGGIPNNLAMNDVFWRVYLPSYRNDFGLIGEYDFSKIGLNTDIPALIMYSETDTPYESIREWNSIFVGKNVYQEYSGGHFFINEHISEITEKIVKWINEENT